MKGRQEIRILLFKIYAIILLDLACQHNLFGVTGHRAIAGIVALCLDIALVSTFSIMAQHNSKFASPCCSLEDMSVMLWV